MKTLYISDLDGTLLNADAEINDKTAQTLTTLIQKGLHFSVATARTQATVVQMLQNIPVNVPIILMNGVAIYDLQQKRYTHIEPIAKNGALALLDAIDKQLHSGFLYCIDDGHLSTYYENTDSPTAQAFIEERQKKYNKKFTKVTSFRECLSRNIVYYSIDNKKEYLEPAYDTLCRCPDLHVEFYRDIYNTEHWYLEISSANASKKNAVVRLKESGGFDRVVSFGDNLNDLPMFDVSDECYAVRNAKDEVKARATGVIAANTENGVIEFLKNRI